MHGVQHGEQEQRQRQILAEACDPQDHRGRVAPARGEDLGCDHEPDGTKADERCREQRDHGSERDAWRERARDAQRQHHPDARHPPHPDLIMGETSRIVTGLLT